MSKQKFKVSRKEPAKLISEMNEAEAQRIKDKATAMANAAGWADEARLQNYWIGIEAECAERINQLKNKEHDND